MFLKTTNNKNIDKKSQELENACDTSYSYFFL